MSKEGIKQNWELYKRWLFDDVVVQHLKRREGVFIDCDKNNPVWATSIEYREKPAEPRKFVIYLDMNENPLGFSEVGEMPIYYHGVVKSEITVTEDISGE